MTFEEIKNHYSLSYEVVGLPEGMKVEDYFTPELIMVIKNSSYPFFYIKDLQYMFKSNYLNNECIDILVSKLLYSNVQILDGSLEDIVTDQKGATKFLDSLFRVLDIKNSIKLNGIICIIGNDIIRKIILNSEYDISFLSNIFNARLKKEVLLELLQDERFINILLRKNLYNFCSFINNNNISRELNEIIVNKINSSSYKDKLDVITRIYKPDEGKPEYLSELYLELKDVINRKKVRDVIIGYIAKPNDKDEELVRNILNTSEGRDIVLSEILEPNFSKLVDSLGLDKSIYEDRKNAYLDRLKDYKKYDINTIKDLLCLYCFNDLSINVSLRLKTIIEYVNHNEDALNDLLEDMPYIIKLMSFLSSVKLDVNPLDLISNLDINGIVKSLHSRFSDDVNKKTDIRDILSSDKAKEVDGVKIIDVDIPLDRSYFIVHSVVKDDLGDDSVKEYVESSKKHDRICTSVLDNNHMNTFLDGVVFGYCNINMPLYSAVPFDGQTNQRIQGSGRPQYRSVISSVDRFMKRTTGYNELTYFTNNELLMPDYILVINKEPNEYEIKVAKDFNIPILIYHTKKVDFEYESGFSTPEAFNYEREVLDYIPNENSKELMMN